MIRYASKRSTGKSALSGPWISLRRLAAELAPEETRSGLRCVFCNGGSSGENSLSLTRLSDSEALYCCHRASCGKSGRVACYGFRLAPRNESGDNSPADGPKKTQRLYTGTIQSLDSRWQAFLLQSFQIREEETTRAGWGQDTGTGRLVIPIFNRRAIRVGTECRKPPFSSYQLGPKTRLYFNESGPRQGWFRTSSGRGPVVLVEDAISALKVSRHFNTVALFGTHINIEKLSEVLEDDCRDVVIALDKDATDKAFKYQKQFGVYCNLKVAVLEKDMKYESDEKIQEIITKAV